jgi:phosphatidylserine decarboxylase
VRTIDQRQNVVTSPADSKCLIIPDFSAQEDFAVKGTTFSLKEFLADEKLAEEYKDGSGMILRLAPSDYHRYHFPFDATPSAVRKIGGSYESVNPFVYVYGAQPLVKNKRNITMLESPTFGKVVFASVGAILVGEIHETYEPGKAYKKGDELGYFSFGGSTVVMIFKKGAVRYSPKILEHSQSKFETQVLVGEPLAMLMQGEAEREE